ncbi:unnamed protein product [Pseudo-nitzschia multistriata]|uniref:Uncharacterized protein n=1 Tax=Pseudo-nitzschia multistriata TaxID=183589 RepID=A0A448Z740_9STRA|nr:unnamed protein product [Pseudo-nitzschia multistriata]
MPPLMSSKPSIIGPAETPMKQARITWWATARRLTMAKLPVPSVGGAQSVRGMTDPVKRDISKKKAFKYAVLSARAIGQAQNNEKMTHANG